MHGENQEGEERTFAHEIEDDGVGAGAAEDDDVQQGVGPQAVGAVDTGARRLGGGRLVSDGGVGNGGVLTLRSR